MTAPAPAGCVTALIVNTSLSGSVSLARTASVVEAPRLTMTASATAVGARFWITVTLAVAEPPRPSLIV